MFKVSKDGGGEILLSASACDQCNRKRVHCNKHLPSCDACLEFKLVCTRNRQLKTKPKLTYENVEKFKFTIRRVIRNSAVQLAAQPRGWVDVISRWCCNSLLRVYFYYFVNFLGIPLRRVSRQDLGVLAGALGQIQPRHLFSGVPFQLMRSVGTTRRLLQNATDAYFRYFSNFFPLFTRAAYSARPRSVLLQFVVLRIGLQFLSPSSLNSEICDTLDRYLLTAVVPSRLVCSLDTVQALLASVMGLHETRVASLNASLFHIATCFISALGLHCARPFDLEAQLVMRMATLINFHFVLPCGYSCNAIVHITPRLALPADVEELAIQAASTCHLEELCAISRLTIEAARLQRDRSNPTAYLCALQRSLKKLHQLFLKKSRLLKANLHDPIARQQLLVMAARSRFIRMRLLELACHADPTDITRPLKYRPDFNSPSAPAWLGLVMAIQIVELLALVGSGPYMFLRICMLMNAARFIAQYFHTFADHPNRLQKPFSNRHTLTRALIATRSILTEMQATPILSYEAHSDYKIFQVMLNRYNIDLQKLHSSN
ncbi:hypothetical protein L0F63_004200 [Massospora cicadina]|nr:hypothetical protein L0F63_004200 [Massospora cicadina]